METMNISPELSKRNFERRNAMQEAFDKVEALVIAGTGNKGRLEASKKYLEEVRGTDYRLEEAIAKLVEYYELELEVENRAGEIERILPGANVRKAANDSQYSIDQDKKYKI